MSLPIAIVASGNGTNAQAMIDLMKAGVLDVDIRLVFCNRPGARVLQRAEAAGILDNTPEFRDYVPEQNDRRDDRPDLNADRQSAALGDDLEGDVT